MWKSMESECEPCHHRGVAASWVKPVNTEEFMQKVPPGSRRSRLTPFEGDLVALRDRGYTLAQMCDYLSRNGISASPSNVAAYLARYAPRDRALKQPRKVIQGTELTRDAPEGMVASSPPLTTPAPPPPNPAPSIREIANKARNLAELSKVGRAAQLNPPSAE